MTEQSRQNRTFLACSEFFRTLYELGVRHLVISPGSRSTPLTLAAAAHPGFKKHVILDERSAAFTALGIGKASRQPAVLICTSGTASANYYPAVIEANKSGVPLIVASADRPGRLRNTDANQTIDQLELYGKYALRFEQVTDEEGYASSARQAYERACGGKGPVHLNFPFDKPLEPEMEALQQVQEENSQQLKADPDMPVSSVQNREHANIDGEIIDRIKTCRRPLIVAGQLPSDTYLKEIFKLAGTLGIPVLTEQKIIDPQWAVQGYDGFLRNKSIRNELEPDLIMRFGLQPASKGLLLALEAWQPETHVYIRDESGPEESSLASTHSFVWDGSQFPVSDLAPFAPRWKKQWEQAAENFATYRDACMEHTEELTDGHIFRHFSETIPESFNLFFSNSLPIRDRSLFGRWGTHSLFTNRGASGIDGITSTAIGTVIATRTPTVLFTGDLSFLHDTNALLNAGLLQAPLVIVVINNGGGSIFRMLPIADHKEYFKTYFETPQQADFGKLVEAYGLPCYQVENMEGLESLSIENLTKEHPHTITVIECKTDPDESMRLRRKLWQMQ